jgi:Ca2+/Na+ antiporter
MASQCALQGVSAITLPKNTNFAMCVNGIINATCTCPDEFFLAKLFVNVDDLPPNVYGFIQLMWLFCFYALILYQGSNLISDGSELLLLIPEYISGELVGSIVLPILGAVPDGAIVLFSGLGPDAQDQLNVGIGGLAGSTIMLLTIPWFLSIYAGRVDCNSGGSPSYRRRSGKRRLSPDADLWMGSGVAPKARNMVLSGRIMFATACIYLVIQIPAFILVGDDDSVEQVTTGERWWAFTGMLLSAVFFCIYLWFQAKLADDGDHPSSDKNEHKKVALQTQEIESGAVSIAAFFHAEDDESLLGGSKVNPATEAMLRMYFKKYDLDGNGEMSISEMGSMMTDLNISYTPEDLRTAFKIVDENGDGEVQFDEFLNKIRPVVAHLISSTDSNGTIATLNNIQVEKTDSVGDDDDEEEPEIPEDLAGITDRKVLAKKILYRSCWMMFLGTSMVLVFSDPMVDVFSGIGKMVGVDAFYVSFVLAPLASNASELIAAYNYAMKKTTTTITTSLTALQGAACMNNTFCLGIFMALIFFKKLEWNFSAETISIVFVQFAMVLISMKKYHFMRDAWAVLALYPVSLVLVWFLESQGLK